MSTKRSFGEYSYKFDQDEEWEGFITASGSKISPVKAEMNDKIKNILKVLDSNPEILNEPISKSTENQEYNSKKKRILEEDLEDIELLDSLPDFIATTPTQKSNEKSSDNSSPPKTPENHKNIIYNKLSTSSTKVTPNKFSTPSPVTAKISPSRNGTLASPQVLKGSPLKTILKSNQQNRKPVNSQFKSPLKTGGTSNLKTPSKVRKIMYSKNSTNEDIYEKNNDEDLSPPNVNENKISDCI